MPAKLTVNAKTHSYLDELHSDFDMLDSVATAGVNDYTERLFAGLGDVHRLDFPLIITALELTAQTLKNQMDAPELELAKILCRLGSTTSFKVPLRRDNHDK